MNIRCHPRWHGRLAIQLARGLVWLARKLLIFAVMFADVDAESCDLLRPPRRHD